MMLLLDRARVYRFDTATKRFIRHRSVLIDDGTIVALDEEPIGIGIERRDLEGATVLPAFTDCHVHLAQTGYWLGPRSLTAVRSYAEFDAAIANLPREDGMVYAGQFDDALWDDGSRADSGPLERHHGNALGLVKRVDGHSCLVNRRTLDWLDLPRDIDGIERDSAGAPTGRLSLNANWAAQSRFLASIPLGVQRGAERLAAEHARANGILAVHVQLIGRSREEYRDDVEFLRSLTIRALPKICETDATIARDLGLPFIGGDVFLDGSIGSCTAAISEPYLGNRGNGSLRFDDATVEAYVAGAEILGISAGVHAIGDAAIDQFVRAVRTVLRDRPSPRGTHHFIEHFEMPRREHVDACLRMEIHCSMQPQFHATWGGEAGMYDDRLGTRRRKAMNPIRSIVRSGGLVAGGSDSPVCSLDALAGMHAACTLQEPEACLDPHEALALYTVNAAVFSRTALAGNIAPGCTAELVVLDNDPLDDTAFNNCRVLDTVEEGSRRIAN